MLGLDRVYRAGLLQFRQAVVTKVMTQTWPPELMFLELDSPTTCAIPSQRDSFVFRLFDHNNKKYRGKRQLYRLEVIFKTKTVQRAGTFLCADRVVLAITEWP